MKTLTPILFLFCLNSIAQEITTNGDTTLINGKKAFYIRVLQKTSLLQGGGEYSVRTMDGKEIIYYKNWFLTFMDDGKKADFTGKEKLIPFAKYLIDNELFTENGFNEDGKRRYIIKKPFIENKYAIKPATNNTVNGVDYVSEYGGEFLGKKKNTNENGGYEMVERNRGGMINVFFETIQQSGVDIGKIKETSEFEDGEGIVQVIFIKTLSGKTIAKAKYSDFTSTSLNFVTSKDSKTHHISYEYSTQRNEKLCKFLVDNLYL